MLKVLRDRIPGARLRDRMAAAEWLTDRGFGRPVQAVGVAMATPEEERIPLEVLHLMQPTEPPPGGYDYWNGLPRTRVAV